MKKYIILLWLALIANVVQGQQLVRQVQTLADLANVADGFQSLYNVQYGYTEGDGLGGVFFYDSDGAASTNLFNVVDSVLVPGQWVRSEMLQKELRLGDDSTSPYTGFAAPSSLAGNVVYTMPPSDGTSGYVLSTDGSKVLTWQSAAGLASDDLVGSSISRMIGPSMYFDGLDDYITIADSDLFTFVNGNDELGMTIVATVKFDQLVDGQNSIITKFGATGATREWRLYTDTDNKLKFERRTDDLNYVVTSSNAVLSPNEWYYITVIVPACGPNTGLAYSAATAQLFINNEDETLTAGAQTGTYAGMSNKGAPIDIGRRDGGDYLKGYIKRVTVLNRVATSSEITALSRGDLPVSYADSWGDHTSNTYSGDSADFTSTLGNWGEYGATAITVAQNGGVAQITNTAATTGSRGLLNSTDTFSRLQRYRFSFYARASSGTGQEVRIRTFNGGAFRSLTNLINGTNTSDYFTFTPTGTLTRYSFDFIGKHTAADYLIFDLANNTGAGEVYDIDDIDLVPIGMLADFMAENLDSVTGKLYDESSNGFVGVNTGPVVVGRSYPLHETGTWTPSITFGGGSTGITYTTQEGHYTRYGNWVSVHAYILLSAKGSDTGTALIAGLPFTARNTAASSHSLSVGNMANAANLTSAVTAYATDNGTTINLVDWGATGIAVLDDTNFGATTSISVTGTYQIQ